MKICQTCRRIYPDGDIECAVDGGYLNSVQAASAHYTAEIDDVLPVMDKLPYVDASVDPHEDWDTWMSTMKVGHGKNIAHIDMPPRDKKTSQRLQLASVGVFFAIVGFALRTMAATPSDHPVTYSPSSFQVASAQSGSTQLSNFESLSSKGDSQPSGNALPAPWETARQEIDPMPVVRASASATEERRFSGRQTTAPVPHRSITPQIEN